jgi:2-polyprenyl-3-methyl-5-hydroxy-6-metoxy-1,4-benzoquinol methylase
MRSFHRLVGRVDDTLSVSMLNRGHTVIEDFLALAEKYGGDTNYLKFHYTRLIKTLEEYESTAEERRGKLVLDIGAHWCHQALLWNLHGYNVIAADLANPIEYQTVKHLCAENGIQRLVYDSLENPVELGSLQESSIDVVLFTEIIEHLTFNPIAFWKQVHRLLKPSGRILVSTPNFYYLGRRPLRSLRRCFRGDGAGISVQDILERHTTNPHWKEYSKNELIQYFQLLSPDFVVRKALFVSGYYQEQGNLDWIETFFTWLQQYMLTLRQNLHVEVELINKQRGITISPEWK